VLLRVANGGKPWSTTCRAAASRATG